LVRFGEMQGGFQPNPLSFPKEDHQLTHSKKANRIISGLENGRGTISNGNRFKPPPTGGIEPDGPKHIRQWCQRVSPTTKTGFSQIRRPREKLRDKYKNVWG